MFKNICLSCNKEISENRERHMRLCPVGKMFNLAQRDEFERSRHIRNLLFAKCSPEFIARRQVFFAPCVKQYETTS